MVTALAVNVTVVVPVTLLPSTLAVTVAVPADVELVSSEVVTPLASVMLYGATVPAVVVHATIALGTGLP